MNVVLNKTMERSVELVFAHRLNNARLRGQKGRDHRLISFETNKVSYLKRTYFYLFSYLPN